VAGWGKLNSAATIPSAEYSIWNESFVGDFRLLQLQGYDIIFGCDRIHKHSPITIDLRLQCKNLKIQKNGQSTVIFKDFTTPPVNNTINVAKLQKLCRAETLGYAIQVNLLQQQSDQAEQDQNNPAPVKAILTEYTDVFSDKFMLPPKTDCDHEIPLLEGSRPPNLRSYRIPHKQCHTPVLKSIEPKPPYVCPGCLITRIATI
jgi:hypothetical protein